MMTRETINIPTRIKASVFSALFLLLLSSQVHAQLELFPTNRIDPAYAPKNASPSARTQATDVTLNLPFFDDFSDPTDGLYPNVSLWDSSASVWINDAMGRNAPTRNVATFDGLDSAGLAYNSLHVLQNGFTDSLTSKKIDLSESGLPVGERFSLFLSFFFQWQGNGEPPDPTDYLQLQFKDDQKNWNTVMTIRTKDSFTRNVFYDTIIQINESKYFHNKFQFRFRTFGRESGPYDTWNIDYVYLNSERTINDLSFPDQAVSSTLTNLFAAGYRSIPFEHFKAGASLLTAPKFTLSNLKNFPEPVNYKTEGIFTKYYGSDSVVFHDPNLDPSNGTIGINDDGSNTIDAFATSTVTLKHLPNPADATQFDPQADAVKVELVVDLDTGDNIQPDYTPNYEPIEFRTNDTIRSTYMLKDYYAYDDGHAEYAAGLTQAGNLVAYEFELRGVTQDTLTGFEIYLPAYGVASNQSVEFFIYGSKLLDVKQNPEDPDDVLLSIPPKVIQRKGVDEFQRITFLPAILIPDKTFYIGWREPATGNVLVGLDANNNSGDKIWVNTNGTWYQNNRVNGSLMLRPIFSKGEIDPTTGIEDAFEYSIYPNPTKGAFYVDGDVDHVRMLSITGQPVHFESEKIDQRMLITLQQPAGIYILQVFKGKTRRSQKIAVSR
jgi:hypothetical protein